MSGRGGEKSREQQLKGIAAAPGIAIGKVYKLSSSALNVESPERRTITPEEIKEEQGRFTLALDRTRDELLKLRNKISSELNSKDAEIFDAHLMIVEDRMLYDEVMQMIEDSLLAADFSYYTVINRYAAAIAAMPDAYIQERAADIRDVGARVLRNLQNLPKDENGTKKSDEPYIVIAHDLTPSDTAALDRGMVLGFATESGSKTSHSAVLARSMQLPALVGLGEGVADMVDNGDEVIIDGFSGFLIINPSAASKEQYARKADDMNRFLSSLTQAAKLRPETLDGFMVQLSSNIESLDDLPQVKKFGSCGVGLFRSEYMFLTSSTPPDEESQLNTYRSILKELGDEPLIVRTLDVGGDKLNNQLRRYAEDNPFLGLRGIRLSLRERQDLLRTQLRALLRAGVYGNLRVMIPMVSCIEEVVEVKQIIQELQLELKRERKDFVQHLELGAMVETPAAALMAEKLAHHVDFFSIGTNDLIQYTMAIDRGNERVAYLYQPGHPVVLKLINSCVSVARRHNIYVSVCGQAAADPRLAILFAGLGVHELSMVPANIGAVRRVIRQMTMFEAEQAGQMALQCSTAAEVMKIAGNVLAKVAPEVVALVEDGNDG